MSDSTPAMTAPDSPRSSVGPLDKGPQRAMDGQEPQPQIAVAGPSIAFAPRRLDVPLTPSARRASIIHVLPAGPPGSVPEIAEHLNVMEPAESWRERRQSHSLLARWQGGSQLGAIPEAIPVDHDGQAAEAWQQFLNVPADDLDPQLPPSIDIHVQGDGDLLASLGLELPASSLRNAGMFDDRASAFAEGRSWVDSQSAMPWTRDEVVRGSEAWFARSGHIPTVPLLVQPHWDLSAPFGRGVDGRQ
ncbi:MAG: hypothetical protein INR71_16145 [Terriglobus roseus]|nr:hypothetical protein [Terriglobus roseus]